MIASLAGRVSWFTQFDLKFSPHPLCLRVIAVGMHAPQQHGRHRECLTQETSTEEVAEFIGILLDPLEYFFAR